MLAIFKTLVGSEAGLAPLVLRIVLGVIFIAHGGQKLFAWFGGDGLQGTAQWMSSIGLEPGYFMALLAGTGEFFAGVFLLLGLLTRIAGFALAVTMLVAIYAVHFQQGFFIASGGYEFALALLAGSVSLLISGAGKFALDNALATRLQSQGGPDV